MPIGLCSRDVGRQIDQRFLRRGARPHRMIESTQSTQPTQSAQAARPTRSSRRRPTRSPPTGWLITAGCLVSAWAVAIGGWTRASSDLVPDEGVGYALGVIGLACMVSLLGYSLRKRWRAIRGVGRLTTWFQIHMLLGLLGPVAILYHCNFRLGSLNSNVALMSALAVSGSGVVGRLLYTRIHYGLSARRATLDVVRSEVEQVRSEIGALGHNTRLWEELLALEEGVIRPKSGVLDELWAYLTLGTRSRSARRRALRLVRGGGSADLRGAVGRHVRAVRRIGGLHVYERIFGLWHVLHLPLCFLLFLAAAVHVMAVHLY